MPSATAKLSSPNHDHDNSQGSVILLFISAKACDLFFFRKWTWEFYGSVLHRWSISTDMYTMCYRWGNLFWYIWINRFFSAPNFDDWMHSNIVDDETVHSLWYWTGYVVWTELSLKAPKVGKMITSNAASVENFVKWHFGFIGSSSQVTLNSYKLHVYTSNHPMFQ